MPPNGYNTAVWTFYLIFYLIFVLMEVPSNLLMNYSRVPPNYWLATSMVLLGIVTICQGLCPVPSAFLQLLLCVSWLSANAIGRANIAMVHALQIGFGNSAKFVSAIAFITGESPRFRIGLTTGLVITPVGLVGACVMEAIIWT